MMNTTRLTATGKDARSGGAVFDYLKATEYYVDRNGKQMSSSRWFGGGAQVLGLKGVVDVKDMDSLGQGLHPKTGEKLRQNGGESTRMGWDFTASANPGLSFMYSIGTPDERDILLKAHQAAFDKTMSYAESALSRVRTGKLGLGPQLHTTGIVVSAHTHFGSRNLDPQVHTHGLVYNVAQGEDGIWRSLHADYMNKQIRTLGALNRAQEAWELKQQGYGIIKDRELDADGRETGDVYFHVAGIDQALIDRISTRRQEIVAYAQEHGIGMDAAALATRKSKDEPTYSELTTMWEKSLAEFQEQHPDIKVPTLDELKHHQAPTREVVTDEDILQRLHVHESAWTRADLVERLALEHVGEMDIAAIVREADAFLERNHIVELTLHNDLSIPPGEMKYAAQWMLDMEREIGERGVARMNDTSVKVPKELYEQAVKNIEQKKGITIADEQRNSGLHMTHVTGGMAIVGGRAGTGKTMSSEVAVEAWRLNGQEVIGSSVAWNAAKQLESDAGIKSYSAEKLLADLASGKMQLNSKHVLLFDEAGMAGTQNIHKLQSYVDAAGAKMVLQGDAKQLAPVSAGNPFQLLTEKLGAAELTEIRRQRHKPDREIAHLMYTDGPAKGAEAMQRLEANGRVNRYESQKAAAQDLAQHWMASSKPTTERLAYAGTRSEVEMLNREIRALRKAAGDIGQDDFNFIAKADGELFKLEISTGDRIRFSDRDKPGQGDLKVYAGYQGVIEKMEPGKHDDSRRLTVRLQSSIDNEHDRIVKFDTADFRSLSHAYAMTVHKAQGQGKEETFHLASTAMMDEHMGLVALTRHKDLYRMFGEAGDIDDMHRLLGRERDKLNATDLLDPGHIQPKNRVKEVEKPQVTLPDDAAFKSIARGIEHESQRKRGKGLSL